MWLLIILRLLSDFQLNYCGMIVRLGTWADWSEVQVSNFTWDSIHLTGRFVTARFVAPSFVTTFVWNVTIIGVKLIFRGLRDGI